MLPVHVYGRSRAHGYTVQTLLGPKAMKSVMKI